MGDTWVIVNIAVGPFLLWLNTVVARGLSSINSRKLAILGQQSNIK